MTRYDLLDIKAALDKASNWAHSQKDLFQMIDAKKKVEAMLNEPSLPGIEENGIPGKDFIPVEWVDACEMYGKWEIVKVEQPELKPRRYAETYYQKGLYDGIIKGRMEILKGLEEIEKRKADPILIINGQEHPEVFDTVAFQKGVQEGRRLEREDALTISDIEKLHTFLYAVKNGKHRAFTFTRLTDEQYEEVLRRFNNARTEE